MYNQWKQLLCFRHIIMSFFFYLQRERDFVHGIYNVAPPYVFFLQKPRMDNPNTASRESLSLLFAFSVSFKVGVRWGVFSWLQ